MPAVSNVSISNDALINVGSDRLIESLDEGSKEADLCNHLFEHARDFVLSDFPWPFARKRVTLTQLSNDNEGWDYRYRYPVDCVQALYIVDGAPTGYGDEGMIDFAERRMRIPFEIGGDGDAGRVIFTNQEDAALAYTQRIENAQVFDSHFIAALGWYLATRLALPITKNPKMVDAMKNQYIMALDSAAARASNEGQRIPAPESAAVRARLDDG